MKIRGPDHDPQRSRRGFDPLRRQAFASQGPLGLDAAYAISRYGGFTTNPMRKVTPDG
jgi:hypothetical protein